MLKNEVKRRRFFLRLDRGFIDQHDGNIVFHRIDAVALGALQTLRTLAVHERLLAGWANQNVEKIFGNHNGRVVRHQSGGV